MKISEEDKSVFAARLSRKKRRAAVFPTLTAEEKLAYISVNGDPTEFEIQSFVYEELKSRGFTVRGEIRSKCATCKFDIVVFAGTRPVRIIEIKKHRSPPGTATIKKRARSAVRKQVSRYATFGVPVDVIFGLKQAKEYVANFLVV